MKVVTRLFIFTALISLFGLVQVPQTLAQTPEQSFLRVGEPLNVGGTVIDPGTYVIKVLRHLADRDVLQVLNEDQSKVVVTVLSTPHPVPATEEERNNVFVFYPSAGGSPKALRTWFAPNPVTDAGHDIVYVRHHATQLASTAKTSVVATNDEITTEQYNTTPLVVVGADRNESAYVAPVRPMTSATPAPVPERSMASSTTETSEATETATTEAREKKASHRHHMRKE